MNELFQKLATQCYSELKKLNFKCFVGQLRWHEFFRLYRSRTDNYEEPYPQDFYVFFAIENGDISWDINETTYRDRNCPEISYPEACKRILAIPEYPKENKTYILTNAMNAEKRTREMDELETTCRNCKQEVKE